MECSYLEVDVEHFMREYRDVERFVGYCKQCPRYGSSWACPPFDNNKELTQMLSKYRYAYIFGFKVTIAEELRCKANNIEQRTELTYQILNPVRDLLDNHFFSLEKRLVTDCRVFFSGRCRRCAPNDCTRLVGRECIKPHEMRHSLESLGFDLGRTISDLLKIELKWSTDNTLPEYLMAVLGVFSMDKLTAEELNLFAEAE